MNVLRVLPFLMLAIVLLLIPMLAVAQEPVKPKDLRLQDVLRAAYNDNPTLKAARAELRAVHERLPQAEAGYKPTASANGRVESGETEDDFGSSSSTGKSIGASVNQPLYRGGRTVAAMSSARDFIAAQTAILNGAEQDILLQAATAYMDVVRDRALLDLSRNNQNVIGEQLKAARERFEVGDLTLTDVSQSEARFARAEADITASQATLKRSEAVFEEIIGFAPPAAFDVTTVNLPKPTGAEESASLAEQNNPDVIAATLLQRSSESDVDNVFGELLPSVGLFAEWNKAYDPLPGLVDEQENKTIGISASIPLYEGGAVRSRVRAAKETANQRYMQILEARRNAHQRAITSWEALEAARAEIKSREAQVKASEVAKEGVVLETELGARTILDSLDADQELLDARASLVTARRNEIVANFTLANVLGALAPENLGFGEDSVNHQAHLDDVRARIFNMDVDSVAQD